MFVNDALKPVMKIELVPKLWIYWYQLIANGDLSALLMANGNYDYDLYTELLKKKSFKFDVFLGMFVFTFFITIQIVNYLKALHSFSCQSCGVKLSSNSYKLL